MQSAPHEVQTVTDPVNDNMMTPSAGAGVVEDFDREKRCGSYRRSCAESSGGRETVEMRITGIVVENGPLPDENNDEIRKGE